MNPLDIQKIRIKLLESIYQKSDGIIGKPLEVSEINPEFQSISEERLNSELIYLIDKGYLNQISTVGIWGQTFIHSFSLSSSGADLIQKGKQNMDTSEFYNDFAKEAISIISIGSVDRNATLIVNSPNTMVNNTYNENDINEIKKLILLINAEAKRNNRKEILEIGEKLIRDIESNKKSNDYLKGALTIFLNLSTSITANFMTPPIQQIVSKFLS